MSTGHTIIASASVADGFVAHASFAQRSFLRKSAAAALLLCAFAVSSPSIAATPQPPTGATMMSDKAQVSYRDLNALTEIKDNPSSRTEWVNDLSKYIVQQAGRVVPDGQRLVVTLDDVQLAGIFEPRRGPNFRDVRFVRDNTPPRIDLTFRLEAAQGGVLKEGERKLRNTNFLYDATIRHRGDALSFEKNLIDDWMRDELAAAK